MKGDSLLLHLAVSLAIGLLIGLERAWHQRADQDRRAAGIRTYALAGLAGGLTAELGQILGGTYAAAGLLAFAAIFAGFEAREAVLTKSFGATSAIAGLVVFLLGAMAAVGDVQAAVASAIAAAALLAFREVLHGFVARLTWEEVRSGIILLAMGLLMLPLLPEQPVDPWGALDLRAIWLIATTLAAVSFAGWLAVRSFGARWGILLVAATGGLASSTATTASLARLALLPGARPGLLAAGMCVSGAVSMTRIAVLVAVLRPSAISLMALPYAAALAVLAGAALWLLRGGGMRDPAEGFALKTPLDLAGALRMTALFAGVSVIAVFLKAQFGSAGFLAVAAVSGLVDLDAITVTATRMGGPDLLAVQGVLLATGVNLVVKAGIAASLGGTIMARTFWPPTILAVAAGAGVFLLVP
jgi:uncharacterized membrane protein (DUF4010 family)